MDDLLKLLPAITSTLALAGVIVSVILNHSFAKANEDRKRLDNLRISAYSDYIDSLSRLMLLESGPSPARDEANIKYIIAQSRVLLFGSREVLESIIHHKVCHAHAHGEEAERLAILTICQRMRNEFMETKERIGNDVVLGVLAMPAKSAPMGSTTEKHGHAEHPGSEQDT